MMVAATAGTLVKNVSAAISYKRNERLGFVATEIDIANNQITFHLDDPFGGTSRVPKGVILYYGNVTDSTHSTMTWGVPGGASVVYRYTERVDGWEGIELGAEKTITSGVDLSANASGELFYTFIYNENATNTTPYYDKGVLNYSACTESGEYQADPETMVCRSTVVGNTVYDQVYVWTAVDRNASSEEEGGSENEESDSEENAEGSEGESGSETSGGESGSSDGESGSEASGLVETVTEAVKDATESTSGSGASDSSTTGSKTTSGTTVAVNTSGTVTDSGSMSSSATSSTTSNTTSGSSSSSTSTGSKSVVNTTGTGENTYVVVQRATDDADDDADEDDEEADEDETEEDDDGTTEEVEEVEIPMLGKDVCGDNFAVRIMPFIAGLVTGVAGTVLAYALLRRNRKGDLKR